MPSPCRDFFWGSVVASHHRKGHATLDTHDTIQRAIGAVFFGEADFLFSSITLNPPSTRHHPTHPSKPHRIKHPLSKIVVNERAEPIEFIFCAFVECFAKFCYLWKKLGFSE